MANAYVYYKKKIALQVDRLNKLLKLNDSKSKTVVLNAFYSIFIKVLNVSVNFLTIPLVLTFLSVTQYGIWLTLTAVLGWFSLFDLGFGNGLRNHLTIAVAKGDFEKGRIYVSTTYAALSIIFGSLIVIFLCIHPFINWVKVFNAPVSMEYDLNNAVLFAICFLFVQFVVRLINTVLLSFQRAAMADLTNALVQVVILIGLFLLKSSNYNSLTAVAVVYSLSPIIIFFVFTFYLFFRPYHLIRPSISFVKRSYVSKLIKLGINFFVIQIAALVLFASDNFIIAQLFAPAQVTTYNVAYKYFSIASVFFTIILTPVWSMTTQAYVEKDWTWIVDSMKKLKFVWAGLLVGGLLQMGVATPLYKIWTNNKVLVPFQLSLIMFLYFVTTNWCSIYSNFLNGVGKIKIQLLCGVIGMVFNVPFAIFLAKYCKLGIIGIPLATISTMIFANIVNLIQYNKIINNNAHGIWNK